MRIFGDCVKIWAFFWVSLPFCAERVTRKFFNYFLPSCRFFSRVPPGIFPADSNKSIYFI